MSVDTKMWISIKYYPFRFIKILEKIKGVSKVKTQNTTNSPDIGCFTICFEYNNRRRTMFYHYQSETPLGVAVLVSLGSDKDAIEIMKLIAEKTGGIIQPEDCMNRCVLIDKGDKE